MTCCPCYWGSKTIYERWHAALYELKLLKGPRSFDNKYVLTCPSRPDTNIWVETVAYNRRLSSQKISRAKSPSKKFVIGDVNGGYWFDNRDNYRVSNKIPAPLSTNNSFYGFYPWHSNLRAGTMMHLDGHVEQQKLDVTNDLPNRGGWWYATSTYY